jgi:translation initiation factor 4E
MANSTLPPAAEKANANTLSDALAAASLSDTPSPSSEPKELNGNDADSKDVKDQADLEDGEIREEDEEDDGKVKTVFDSAKKFNVKVGLNTVALVRGISGTIKDTSRRFWTCPSLALLIDLD